MTRTRPPDVLRAGMSHSADNAFVDVHHRPIGGPFLVNISKEERVRIEQVVPGAYT